jgi:phospholipase C
MAMAVVGIVAPAPAASPGALSFSSLCGAMAGSHPYTVRHVMFILEENRSFPQVIGNPSVLGGREYAQSMPSNCYPANDGYYLVRHAPPPYYTAAPVPSKCKNWDVPERAAGGLHHLGRGQGSRRRAG